MRQWAELLEKPAYAEFHDFLSFTRSNLEGQHATQFRLNVLCDRRVAIENTLESVHVPHVHKDSLHKLGIELKASFRRGKHSFAEYEITNERALRGLNEMAKHFKFVTPSKYTHLFLYPYVTIASVGGFTVSVQEYLNAGPKETRLVSTLYRGRLRSNAPDVSFFFNNAYAFNTRVFREDAAMCQRVHVRNLRGDVPPALQRLAWYTEAQDEEA